MMPPNLQAAKQLEGKLLPGDWLVGPLLTTRPGGTGGAYSSCYLVSRPGGRGFLKAFDLSPALKAGPNTQDQIMDILKAFGVEKKILEQCTINGFRNVVSLISSGEYDVPGSPYPKVYYLILEYAGGGDMRSVLNANAPNMEKKIWSLHQLAKGLSQLHSINVAHQDIKPSNVVSTSSGQVKISDFGSAISLHDIPESLPSRLNSSYAGSWEYAPPELLYGNLHADNIVRRIGCDLYLLGSMVAHFFTNMSMTALIRNNLHESVSWTNPLNFGRFTELLPVLQHAYAMALEDIRREVADPKVADHVIQIVKYLCDPDPTRRGHEKTRKLAGSPFELSRFITMFDVLYRNFKYK